MNFRGDIGLMPVGNTWKILHYGLQASDPVSEEGCFIWKSVNQLQISTHDCRMMKHDVFVPSSEPPKRIFLQVWELQNSRLDP